MEAVNRVSRGPSSSGTENLGRSCDQGDAMPEKIDLRFLAIPRVSGFGCASYAQFADALIKMMTITCSKASTIRHSNFMCAYIKTFITVVLLLLCACAQSPVDIAEARRDVAPNPGFGRLIVYLNNSVLGSISVNRYNIIVNNTTIGGITATNPIMIDLPSGTYRVQYSNEISRQISGKDTVNFSNGVNTLVATGSTAYVSITETPLMPIPRIENADQNISFGIVSRHPRNFTDSRKLGFVSAPLHPSTPPAGLQDRLITSPIIVQPPARVTAPPAADARFAERPLDIVFTKALPRPDDIAVIIGNADYSKNGHDIPDAKTAYADAESMRRYAADGLGIREGNIIFLKDATGIQMAEVFGNERDHRGKLFNWVKPGKSRVFVYYIGHGAPGSADGRAMLVPSDASASQIALSGYPLDILYANLGKVPAERITVVLEACFSGTSPAGSVVGKALPLAIMPKVAPVPANVTVISAAAADQMANWEQDDSHALFTKYFLKGMSGEADKAPYGNGDGTVSLDELDRYLKETLSYVVRRSYGRDQTAQIVKGGVVK